MRLVSYNIRKAIGTDRRRRPDRICEVIRNTGGDVVLLQEADLRLGPRPAALDRGMLGDIAGMAPVVLPSRGVSIGHHGNAILLRHGVEPEAVVPLELPGLEPRGALMVELAGEIGPLRLVAVHLGLRRADRRRQIAAILEAIDSRPERPTLIAGDMNEWSETTGLGALGRRFHIVAPGRSYHSRLPVAPLDRIAVGPGLAIQRAGVDESRLARLASDHLPIWAEVGAG